MIIQDEHKSILTMKNLYVEHISFKRGNYIDNTELEMSFTPSVKIITDDEADFKLILALNNNQNQFELSISMVVTMQKDKEASEWSILIPNILAIAFPFLRSQVSILTAQPNFSPIVLPIVNINKLIENIDINDIIN